MTIALVDTNLFLRALVNDHEHHQKAIAIFDKARSKQHRLVWPSVIFVEVIHALKTSKFYDLGRAEIAALFLAPKTGTSYAITIGATGSVLLLAMMPTAGWRRLRSTARRRR